MENCQNVLICVADYGRNLFEIAFAIIAAASAVAALTPTPADDRLIGKAYRLLDLLALNVGFAKDKAAPSKGGRFVAD